MRFRQETMVWAPEDGGSGGSDAAAVDAPAVAPTDAAGDAGRVPSSSEPASPAGTTLLTEPVPPAEGDEAAEPETPAEPEPIDPASYDIKVPDGIDPDDDLLTAFKEGAAKGGMDNESVQAVIDALGPKLAERLAEPHKAWAELNAEWQKEIRTAPDMGGDKLVATQTAVRRTFEMICTGHKAADGTDVTPQQELERLNEALLITGAGNHPAIVRAFHRLANRLMEPGADGRTGVVTGTPIGATPGVAARMYPSASDGAKSA